MWEVDVIGVLLKVLAVAVENVAMDAVRIGNLR
jgi:hypothetical protein